MKDIISIMTLIIAVALGLFFSMQRDNKLNDALESQVTAELALTTTEAELTVAKNTRAALDTTLSDAADKIIQLSAELTVAKAKAANAARLQQPSPQAPIKDAVAKRRPVTNTRKPATTPKVNQARLRSDIATAKRQLTGYLHTADKFAEQLDDKEDEWREYDKYKRGIGTSKADRDILRKKVKASINGLRQSAAQMEAKITELEAKLQTSLK